MRALIASALAAQVGDPELREGMAVGEIRGRTLTVEVFTEIGGWAGEIRLTAEGDEQEDFLGDLVQCLSGIPAETWLRQPTDVGCVLHARLELEQLMSYAEGRPLSDDSRPAHIVLEHRLIEALLGPAAIRSLCGTVFVPSESGEQARQRQVCVRCLQVYEMVRTVQESWTR